MFKFKKLWASMFGSNAVSATINPPVVVPEEIKAQWKQQAAVRAFKARPTPTSYRGSTPTPVRPSESDTDGMGGISTIVGMEYFADMVDSSPVTNDAPWEGGGGMSGGAGADGSWDSSSSCSFDSSSDSSSSSFDSGSCDSGSCDSGSSDWS